MYNKLISTVTAVAFMIFSSAVVGLTRSYAATINVSPTQDIQTAVNANPTGTTFVIATGLYRMQSVTPKTGDVFLGQPGAILNGSRLLTSFARSGSYYIAGGQTQYGTAVGVCLSGYSACQYPEDLFFNNVPLQRVATLAEVTAGKWYFDYPTAEVYFVDGPISGRNWTIESNEIRLNHGGGIRLDSYQVIKSNYIHHNGQEGLTGTGTNVLVQDNEIAYNNTLNFDFGWEAGGTKFSNMTNLVVQGNYSHDNKGPGFSLDYQCYNWTIQGNRTSNNYVAGILDETSYDGTARYNVIVNDGWYPGKTNPSMWWGCGIFNLDSGNESVYGNTLLNNSNAIYAVSFPRGSGNRGEFLVKNLYAHDNFIVQNVSSAAGAVASTANSRYYLSVYTSWNNRWASNMYQLSNLAGSFYIWTGGSSVDDLQWKIYGQDTAGNWVSSTTTFLSTKFSANQRLQTLLSAQVWSLPDTTSTLITTETTGAQGTVTQVAGPIHSGGVWWWNVRYDDGQEGWTPETSLQGSSLPATAAAAPTFSPSAGTYPAPTGITISDS